MTDNAERDRQLALAVIERAMLDAQTEDPFESEKILAKREGRLFLLSTTGEWARSRTLWCGQAQLDPDHFLTSMREQLGTDP